MAMFLTGYDYDVVDKSGQKLVKLPVPNRNNLYATRGVLFHINVSALTLHSCHRFERTRRPGGQPICEYPRFLGESVFASS